MKKTLAILLALALVLCMMPSAAFAREAIDLATATITLSQTSATYDGTDQKPTVTSVKVGDTVLNAETEYTVAFGEGNYTDKGTYTITVSAASGSSYTGSKTIEYTISPLDLSSAGVEISEKTPITSVTDAPNQIEVTYNGKKLTSGFKTTAAPSSSESGTVLVTITGDGNNLTGTKTAAFYVKTQFDSTYAVSAVGSYTYTGSAIEPTLQFMKDDKSISLLKGTDYTVSYSDNVKAGPCVITVNGIGKYTGTIQGSFTISPKSIAGVSATIPNVVQNGTIAPVVMDGSKTLVEGTDYTYVKPVDTSVAGTKTLTITGIGNYTGTKNITYTVSDSSKAFDYRNVTFATYTPYYNGSLQYQTITVKIGNTTLNNGTDYKVEYSITKDGKTTTTSYAKDAGTYNVKVTGIGSYSGTATGTFTILQVPLDYAEIVLSGSTTTYNGYTVPKVSVKHFAGNFYFPETDYTVTYRYLGSSSAYLKPLAVVTPVANGNLVATSTTKELTKEITYNARSISNCTVNFSDYRSSKNYDGTLVKPTVVVKDYSLNKTLVLNSDYTVSYKDAAGKTVSGFKDAGTYTVVITGIGAYSGETSLTYTINGIDISGYTVTLKEASVKADGYRKVPTIVSVKNGFYSTLSSTDYTVSYEDSTGKTVTTLSAPGTYKVVVTGKNGYTGSTYATYRIIGTPQEIKIDKTAYKVYKDSEPFRITASATGDGTGFSYVSSNPAVATVSANGVVTIHKIGRAKITVTTTGMKLSEPVSDEVYVKVYPDKTKITQKPQTEGNKGSFRVRWEKQDDVTYYEIRYARNSSFRSGTYLTKKVNASTLNYTTQSTKITGLKSGARYYVKVRAVKVVYNDYGQELKYYGKWSNWRSVVTK